MEYVPSYKPGGDNPFTQEDLPSVPAPLIAEILQAPNGNLVAGAENSPINIEGMGFEIRNGGYLRSGMKDYNSGNGWWIGNKNGVGVFSFGSYPGSAIYWNGTTLVVGGGISVTSLDIPDTTTANSFHVDSSGNAWWGQNTAAGYSGAPASVTSAGAGTFNYVTINDTANVQLIAPLVRSYTAGEVLTANDAVFVSDGTQTKEVLNNSVTETTAANFGGTGSSQKYAQPVTVGSSNIAVDKITVNLRKNSAPGDNLVIAIQAESSGPSGVDLATTSISSATLTTSLASYTLTFSSQVILTASTQYWIVFRRSGSLDAVNNYAVGSKVSGGAEIYDGATWSAASIESSISLVQIFTSGRLYKTTAQTSGFYQPFFGFVVSSVAIGATALVKMAGVVNGFSGLTIAGLYYLSNTYGAISTTPGSNTRKVGIAVSATELFVTNIW